jgi:hypothetical protein
VRGAADAAFLLTLTGLDLPRRLPWPPRLLDVANARLALRLRTSLSHGAPPSVDVNESRRRIDCAPKAAGNANCAEQAAASLTVALKWSRESVGPGWQFGAAILLVVAAVIVALLASMNHQGPAAFNNVIGGNGE